MRGRIFILPLVICQKLLGVLSIGVEAHAGGSQRQELNLLVSAILELNLSGSADTQTLALDSGSKDAVNRALLKTQSVSNVSSGNIVTIDALQIV
jgi:hypothetical protein